MKQPPTLMRKIVYISIDAIVAIGLFFLIAPTLVVPDLMYPERIDSIYVLFQKNQFIKTESSRVPDAVAEADSMYIFNPGDLGLKYEPFNIKTFDSLLLQGWYIPSGDNEAISLLVLHDWNESKIMKLNFAKQMHDRGFDVYLIDLRAHGNSEGKLFSPSTTSVKDVKNIADNILKKQPAKHLVLMGSGISACIAMQVALYDTRLSGLVIQCPLESFTKFLKTYSRKDWGVMSRVFYPFLERKMETVIGKPLDQFDMGALAGDINVPSLLIGVSDDSYYSPFDAYSIFQKIQVEKKDLLLIDKATHENIELTGGDKYYNNIAAFINNTIPKKQKHERSKKMVMIRNTNIYEYPNIPCYLMS